MEACAWCEACVSRKAFALLGQLAISSRRVILSSDGWTLNGPGSTVEVLFVACSPEVPRHVLSQYVDARFELRQLARRLGRRRQ